MKNILVGIILLLASTFANAQLFVATGVSDNKGHYVQVFPATFVPEWQLWLPYTGDEVNFSGTIKVASINIYGHPTSCRSYDYFNGTKSMVLESINGQYAVWRSRVKKKQSGPDGFITWDVGQMTVWCTGGPAGTAEEIVAYIK